MWCLKAEGHRPQDWVQLGEQFMEIWLEVTEQGMRLQPFANTLVIANYLQDPGFFKFSKSQSKEIEKLHQSAMDDLRVDVQNACIFFRVGYSSLPALWTPRKDIEAKFETHSVNDKLGQMPEPLRRKSGLSQL